MLIFCWLFCKGQGLQVGGWCVGKRLDWCGCGGNTPPSRRGCRGFSGPRARLSTLFPAVGLLGASEGVVEEACLQGAFDVKARGSDLWMWTGTWGFLGSQDYNCCTALLSKQEL